MARHHAAQPRHREAALPAECALLAHGLDDGIDQDGQTLRGVARHVGRPVVGHDEDHEPVRHVDLGCREPGAARVLHRLDHVQGEPRDPGGGRVVDLGRTATQYRMPHAGDLEQSHEAIYAIDRPFGKASASHPGTRVLSSRQVQIPYGAARPCKSSSATTMSIRLSGP